MEALHMNYRILGVLVASAIAGGAIGSATAGGSVDDRVRRCGIGGEVQAVFDLPRGSAIWQHLPAMRANPELTEPEDGPISVVIYRDKVQGVVVGRAGLVSSEATNAVCVIRADGFPIVYVNVSRAGLRLP
jgi:hypothetical protein